jgi:hypothetical protein
MALHRKPSPVELARGDIDSGDREAVRDSDDREAVNDSGDRKAVNPSEENVTRRAAEKASPKGDGWASETFPCEEVCA